MTFNAQDPFAREWLRDILKEGNVEVTFIKQSTGQERVMICTLRSDAIDYEKKTDRQPSLTDERISVWDIDSHGWRSFRYDSIIRVEQVSEMSE